jgi:phytoene/squalene synthetase
MAVSFLSSEMRLAIYSIYGFVRFADEIVDTFNTLNQKLLLDNFERDYNDALLNGFSMNPVLHSFVTTIKKYNIPPKLVESFLNSMKADLVKHYYNNANEFDEYIYGSADAVGLMCLMVFVNGNNQLYDELEKPAMKLGSAFQKVNFLRDIKADVEQLDRRYFLQFDTKSFDDTFKNQIIENIEYDFKEAKEGIKRLPRKSILAVLVAFIYYKKLLKKLKYTPAKKIMSTRIRLPGYMKIMLLVKAFLKYQFKAI